MANIFDRFDDTVQKAASNVFDQFQPDDVPQLRPEDVFGGPFTPRQDVESPRIRALATAGGTMATFSDEGRKNVWSTQLQQAGVEHRWTQDAEGYDILEYRAPDGSMRSGYVNKPGNIALDLTSIIGQGAAFFGGSALAAPVLRTVAPGMMGSAVGRSAIAAGGGAVQSVATDQAAQQLGADLSTSEQALNALFSAVAAGALQRPLEVAAAAAPSVARRVSQAAQNWATLGRHSSEEAVDATRRLVIETAEGVSPGSSVLLDDLPADWWRNIHREVSGISDPNDAASIALRKAFESEIPGFTPLRPHITGDVADFANVDQAARGRFGPRVQSEVGQIKETNRLAIESRATALQGRMGGGQLESPAQAGDVLREGLRGRADEARATAGQAINDALDMPGSFSQDAVLTIPGRLENALIAADVKLPGEALSPQFRTTQEIVETFNRRAEQGPMTLDEFERLKRYAGSLRRAASTTTPEDARAAGRVIAELEDWIDDSIAQRMYSGSDADIEALRAARGMWREYLDRFTQRPGTTRTGRRDTDPAGKVIADIIELDLTPTAVVNSIIGHSKLGGGRYGVAVLDRLQRAVGRDSVEFKALQEAAHMRIFYDNAGNIKPPQRIVQDWNALKRESGQWLGRLFEPQHIRDMDRLVAVMGRLNPPRDAFVPSGPAVARLEDRLVQLAATNSFGLVGGAVGRILMGGRQVAGELAQTRQGMMAIMPQETQFIKDASLSEALTRAGQGVTRGAARSGADALLGE